MRRRTTVWRKLALTGALALAAQTLAADDVPVEIGRKAFLVDIPDGLAAAKLYRREIRSFANSMFGDCQALLAEPGELENGASKPPYRRYVVLVAPRDLSASISSPESFRQNYAESAPKAFPHPLLNAWADADSEQLRMLEDVRSGTSLTSPGESHPVGVCLATDTAVAVCVFQNLGGSRYYSDRHPAVFVYSYFLVGDRLFQFLAAAELNGPEDIDWAIGVTKKLSTGIVPMVQS